MNEEDRNLSNWLSTRVIKTSEFGMLPDPERTTERAMILRALVRANHRKVPVVPGHYFKRPSWIGWDADIRSYVPVAARPTPSARRRTAPLTLNVQTH
jgi:hypothetical protein